MYVTFLKALRNRLRESNVSLVRHTGTGEIMTGNERKQARGCQHVWVGGMCYVHAEDAESVNAERLNNGLTPLECETCEATYPGTAVK